MAPTTTFTTANNRRKEQAATRTVKTVRRLLDSPLRIPAPLAAAGRLRLTHPQASLAELAELSDPPLSKDAYSGRLRRLIDCGRHLDLRGRGQR